MQPKNHELVENLCQFCLFATPNRFQLMPQNIQKWNECRGLCHAEFSSNEGFFLRAVTLSRKMEDDISRCRDSNYLSERTFLFALNISVKAVGRVEIWFEGKTGISFPCGCSKTKRQPCNYKKNSSYPVMVFCHFWYITILVSWMNNRTANSLVLFQAITNFCDRNDTLSLRGELCRKE